MSFSQPFLSQKSRLERLTFPHKKFDKRLKKISQLLAKGQIIPSQAQLDHMADLLLQGDAVADELLTLFNRLPGHTGPQMLQRALALGIESIQTPPPELISFLNLLD